MFNYFLMPLVTVCTFQLTVTQFTRPYITACSVVLLVVILGISALMSGFICNHRPRSDMYDVLQYLLAYGTLYNTYREKSILFFMTHLYSNILRGIAFGALQPSGIAQITILAVIEIVLILSTYAAKPYPAPTSMNLWHIILSFIRLLTILLMMAFVPSINASPAVRGWTGWVILGIHALVLFIAFLLKGMQTILELSVRGYSHDEAAARGGFAKVSDQTPCHLFCHFNCHYLCVFCEKLMPGGGPPKPPPRSPSPTFPPMVNPTQRRLDLDT